MKNYICILTTIILSGISGTLISQNQSLEQVREEIERLTLIEETAFRNGDCDKLLSMMADNLTFYANGRPSPPRKMIKQFCEKVPRPFPGNGIANLTVYPLSPSAAYVVRTRDFERGDSIRVSEVVTKIWNVIDGEWKMVHLQSTVKENAGG